MSAHVRRGWVSVGVVTLALASWYCFYPRLNAPARVGWKDRAIEAIRAECDSEDNRRFVAPLPPDASREDRPTDLPWVSDTRITMVNGESLVFRNICQKEDFRIPDLFICKGSDGHWYFSTFHFCIGMTVFRYAAAMDGRPASLHAFADQYALEPFDPTSEQCLRRTRSSASLKKL